MVVIQQGIVDGVFNEGRAYSLIDLSNRTGLPVEKLIPVLKKLMSCKIFKITRKQEGSSELFLRGTRETLAQGEFSEMKPIKVSRTEVLLENVANVCDKIDQFDLGCEDAEKIQSHLCDIANILQTNIDQKKRRSVRYNCSLML